MKKMVLTLTLATAPLSATAGDFMPQFTFPEVQKVAPDIWPKVEVNACAWVLVAPGYVCIPLAGGGYVIVPIWTKVQPSKIPNDLLPWEPRDFTDNPGWVDPTPQIKMGL